MSHIRTDKPQTRGTILIRAKKLADTFSDSSVGDLYGEFGVSAANIANGMILFNELCPWRIKSHHRRGINEILKNKNLGFWKYNSSHFNRQIITAALKGYDDFFDEQGNKIEGFEGLTHNYDRRTETMYLPIENTSSFEPNIDGILLKHAKSLHTRLGILDFNSFKHRCKTEELGHIKTKEDLEAIFKVLPKDKFPPSPEIFFGYKRHKGYY